MRIKHLILDNHTEMIEIPDFDWKAQCCELDSTVDFRLFTDCTGRHNAALSNLRINSYIDQDAFKAI